MTSELQNRGNDRNLGRLLKNRYQLQQLLAKTREQRTYLALDQATQHQVVIKCLTFGEEFDWTDLASELSAWLNLPIERTNNRD